MEQFLAKKRSRQNGAKPVEVGLRAVVREGREFEAFKSTDEGLVISVDEQAGTCLIRFDGSREPVTVAIRHLSGVCDDNQQANGKRNEYRNKSNSFSPERKRDDSPPRSFSSLLADKKLNGARWKPKSAGISPRRLERKPVNISSLSSPSFVEEEFEYKTLSEENQYNVGANERWREAGPSTSRVRGSSTKFLEKYLSREASLDVSSEAATEVIEPSGITLSLREVLQKSSDAMMNSLRVAETFKSFKRTTGQEEHVVLLSDGSFQEWQQSLVLLQSAVESCSRELKQSSIPMANNASVAVPVEQFAYRPGTLTPGVRRSLSVPPPSASGVSRSLSVPPLFRNSVPGMPPGMPCSPRSQAPGQGFAWIPGFSGVSSARRHNAQNLIPNGPLMPCSSMNQISVPPSPIRLPAPPLPFVSPHGPHAPIVMPCPAPIGSTCMSQIPQMLGQLSPAQQLPGRARAKFSEIASSTHGTHQEQTPGTHGSSV